MKITLGLFALLVLLVASEEGDLILKAPTKILEENLSLFNAFFF